MVPDTGVVMSVLAQQVEEPDPSIVTPGSLGLAIVLMLGLAVLLLFKSMNKQLKRIDLPEDDRPGPAGPAGAGPGSIRSDGASEPGAAGAGGGASGASGPGGDGSDGDADAQPAR